MKVLNTSAKLLLISFLSFFLLSSCSSDDDNNNSTPEVTFTPPTAQEFKAVRDEALNKLKQEFNLNTKDNNFFTTKNGVEVQLFDIKDAGGNLIAGDYKVEYIEIFKKGDMVLANKPTMGLYPNGKYAFIATGGEFYINITQNGKEVASMFASLKVPSALTNREAADMDMIIWDGTIDDKGDLKWIPVVIENDGNVNANGDGEYYYPQLGNLGWTNIDKFINYPGEKTVIKVKAPEGFNYENSSVYLSYIGEKGLAQLDTFEDGYFSEHYGMVPVGLNCNVIFVSENKGKWTYSIKENHTIKANDIIVFDKSELKISNTTDELINIINKLP